MSAGAAALLLLVQGAPGLDGRPGVTVDYYDVRGTDPAAIRAAIDRARPRDPNDRLGVDALTTFTVRWRWPGDGRGGCALSRVAVTTTVRVLLPRLVGPVPPEVRARWDRYSAATIAHEARHVALVLDRREELLAALRGATCATANAAGEAVLARIRADGIAYDAATDHGLAEGAVFP